MNKTLVTNLIAFLVCLAGYLSPETAWRPYLLGAGLFALSGALTNWLAVHMLFERIPGLKGSGVIVERFDQFKIAIHDLIMANFFTEDNFKMFADVALHESLSDKRIRDVVDLDRLFDGFLEVVTSSKFGSMLALVGGVRALEPLRDPFKVEFAKRIAGIIDDLDLKKGNVHFQSFLPTVEKLVNGKLDQLKPTEVKEILERMIREHLGWLVVWGGVFGGLIGLVSPLLR